jgi:LemA protein
MEQGNMLTQAMKSVFAVSENYPNLKASENFAKLQGSLEETEDQVAAARRIYNANVNDYNTNVQQFPSNIVAGLFKFSEEPFFQTDQVLNEAPQVSF